MGVVAFVLTAATAAAKSDPQGWSWDPASVSAGATVVAAVGTVGTLGYILWNQRKDAETARAAQQSADAAQRSADATQEEAAGAWRPLVRPGRATVTHLDGTTGSYGDRRGTFFRVTLENIGRGPALSLRAQVKGSSRGPLVRNADNVVVDMLAVLNTEENFVLGGYSHDGEPEPSYVIQVDYADLGGREYSTVVTFQKVTQVSSSLGRNETMLDPEGLQVMKGRQVLASDS